MNTEAIRLRHALDGGLTMTCTDCGHISIISVRDLQWTTVSALLAAAEHACRPVAPVPATPRPPAAADAAMASFVAASMSPDPSGVILFSDLVEAYGISTGTYLDSGSLSRRLRKVLPPGAAIRREMINGVRARRLVGMRWR